MYIVQIFYAYMLINAGYIKYRVEKYKNILDTIKIFKNSYIHELYKCICKWKCNQR